jgi:eukaryotic-like serine/threonine-protein kinase
LKLGDFGLARDQNSSRLTIDGLTVGTAKYLSPEQAMAKADIDGRSDLYALGCVLFEMMAGRPPFVAEETSSHSVFFELMEKHVEVAPVSVKVYCDDCPDSLAKLVDRLLAKKPADRPATASEVEEALKSILKDPNDSSLTATSAGEPLKASTESLTQRLQKSRGTGNGSRVRAIVALLAVVAVLILIAVLSSR